MACRTTTRRNFYKVVWIHKICIRGKNSSFHLLCIVKKQVQKKEKPYRLKTGIYQIAVCSLHFAVVVVVEEHTLPSDTFLSPPPPMSFHHTPPVSTRCSELPQPSELLKQGSTSESYTLYTLSHKVSSRYQSIFIFGTFCLVSFFSISRWQLVFLVFLRVNMVWKGGCSGWMQKEGLMKVGLLHQEVKFHFSISTVFQSWLLINSNF